MKNNKTKGYGVIKVTWMGYLKIAYYAFIFSTEETLNKFTNSLWHIQTVNHNYYTLALGTLLDKIKFTWTTATALRGLLSE